MELVAPAGSEQMLQAALANGANSVYLGLQKYSARAKADNFDEATLAQTVLNAHFFGVKVYVALNTLVKDSEFDDALETAAHCYACNVDALIVQDLALAKAINSLCPNIALHASTQLGVHNARGAEAALKVGFKRAVLSRETLPQDIAEASAIIETEYFVQGALCIAFSGNCYFSSLVSGYSGNRGKCMQLCRKKYALDGKEGYFLSAKDLCLLDNINRLRDLGVSALKIEGRMRSSEYVAEACDIYSRAMRGETVTNAIPRLQTVFNRGDYCSAYLDSPTGFSITYPSIQGNLGAPCGTVSAIKKDHARLSNPPAKGSGVKIIGESGEVGGGTVEGDGTVKVGRGVRVGDSVRLTLDSTLSSRISLAPKRNAEVNATAANGTLRVTATCDGATVVSEIALQAATNAPLTEKNLIDCFAKTATLPLNAKVSAKTDGDYFMRISDLNNLRRNLYAKLIDAVTKSHCAKPIHRPFTLTVTPFNGRGTILQVSDLSVVDREIEDKCDYIALSPNDYSKVEFTATAKKILLNMPIVARGDDIKILQTLVADERIHAIIANNPYALTFDKPTLIGTGLNSLNSKLRLPRIASVEADALPTDGAFLYAFGRVPLCTFCHCFKSKCDRDCESELTDGQANAFPIRRYRVKYCYGQLLNCRTVNLLDYNYANRFIDAVGMSNAEIKAVLDGAMTATKPTRGNIGKTLY